MKPKHTVSYAVLLLMLGSVLLAACAPAVPQTPTVDAEALITQAAATVAVQLTLNAALTPSPTPTNTPAPTSTVAPTVESPTQPAPPAAATSTTAPTTNAPVQGDDNASFVEDVTIPDGTGAAPGVQFEKVWRIKNTGKTTWTSAYSLNWVDGERMGAPDSIPMPKEVRPGETVDITVKLTAPSKAGSYQSFFRLRNAAGKFFRLDGTGDLWLKITVGGAAATPDPAATSTPPTATPTTGSGG
jgi:hypothetical protein